MRVRFAGLGYGDSRPQAQERHENRDADVIYPTPTLPYFFEIGKGERKK